jgi:hypothetical protein
MDEDSGRQTTVTSTIAPRHSPHPSLRLKPGHANADDIIFLRTIIDGWTAKLVI